jgi:hypothetical protein
MTGARCQTTVRLPVCWQGLDRYGACRRSADANIEVLEMEGDRTVQQQVIARYLSAEKEGSRTHDAGIDMTPANYRFRYRCPARTEGRLAWVFEIVPRKKRSGLIRGELWIDAASGLVLRQAGRPASNTLDIPASCERHMRHGDMRRCRMRARQALGGRRTSSGTRGVNGRGGPEVGTQRRVEAR